MLIMFKDQNINVALRVGDVFLWVIPLERRDDPQKYIVQRPKDKFGTQSRRCIFVGHPFGNKG